MDENTKEEVNVEIERSTTLKSVFNDCAKAVVTFWDHSTSSTRVRHYSSARKRRWHPIVGLEWLIISWLATSTALQRGKKAIRQMSQAHPTITNGDDCVQKQSGETKRIRQNRLTSIHCWESAGKAENRGTVRMFAIFGYYFGGKRAHACYLIFYPSTPRYSLRYTKRHSHRSSKFDSVWTTCWSKKIRPRSHHGVPSVYPLCLKHRLTSFQQGMVRQTSHITLCMWETWWIYTKQANE